jgi:secondary thiamine-phosphate synthase enzyme
LAGVGENANVIVFKEFETKTGCKLDAIDLTDEVAELVRASGVEEGSVLVFSPHTTCCVMVGAPGGATVAALEEAMERIAPDGAYYAHDDLAVRTENLVEDESANAPAHIFHVIAGGASQCIPVTDGKLTLGDDQRILFVELDCSRARRYCVQVLGE